MLKLEIDRSDSDENGLGNQQRRPGTATQGSGLGGGICSENNFGGESGTDDAKQRQGNSEERRLMTPKVTTTRRSTSADADM